MDDRVPPSSPLTPVLSARDLFKLIGFELHVMHENISAAKCAQLTRLEPWSPAAGCMSVEDYIRNVLFRRMDENKLTSLLRAHYEKQGKLGEWGDIRDAYTVENIRHFMDTFVIPDQLSSEYKNPYLYLLAWWRIFAGVCHCGMCYGLPYRSEWSMRGGLSTL